MIVTVNSESVDLIATDPPFNKGWNFHATPDSLAKGASVHVIRPAGRKQETGTHERLNNSVFV